MRPESLETTAEGGNGTAPIAVQIEVVEPLGHENIVHARVGDEFVTATLDPQASPAVGDQVELAVVVDTMHLFDAETTDSLMG